MNSKTVLNSLRVFAGCLLICIVSGVNSPVIARGGGYHGGGFHGGGFHEHGWSRGYFHPHFWGGFYIGSEWFWGPTIVIAGTPYYCYDGIYYTPDGDELVAVAPPPEASATVPAAQNAPANTANTPAKAEAMASQQSGDTITINVPNVSGGFTPVKLVKHDKGFLGPQGEYYPTNPTIAELKVLYGK